MADESNTLTSQTSGASFNPLLSRRGALTLAGIAAGLVATLGEPGLDASAASEPVWGHPLTLRGVISSGFRVRERPSHDGIDFHNGYAGARGGDSIRSIADGQVRSSGWAGDYGNLVVVDHGGGWISHYAHTENGSFIAAGTTVRRGTHLATIGTTGHSFGPHLHLEMKTGGAFIDPAPKVASAPLPGEPAPQPVPTEWDVMATKEEIKQALAEVLGAKGAIIVNYPARNVIYLAAPGFWHQFTGEEWTQFTAHGLNQGMKIVQPVNDRDRDVLREIHTLG